jgi:hypothetical protein
MIENFFVFGMRLKWTFPGDKGNGSRDGSIIDNPQAPLGEGPLVYDGMDGQLFDLTQPSVVTKGLKVGESQASYDWLVYAPGHTTKRMLSGRDILTGYMSGCLITLWRQDGSQFVGHIGTDSDDKPSTEKVKTAFAEFMPEGTTGFDPFGVWKPTLAAVGEMGLKFKGGAQAKFFGIVTPLGQFHSLLLFKLSQNEWCVGGIKPVEPLNRDALKQELLKK